MVSRDPIIFQTQYCYHTEWQNYMYILHIKNAVLQEACENAGKTLAEELMGICVCSETVPHLFIIVE